MFKKKLFFTFLVFIIQQSIKDWYNFSHLSAFVDESETHKSFKNKDKLKQLSFAFKAIIDNKKTITPLNFLIKKYSPKRQVASLNNTYFTEQVNNALPAGNKSNIALRNFILSDKDHSSHRFRERKKYLVQIAQLARSGSSDFINGSISALTNLSEQEFSSQKNILINFLLMLPGKNNKIEELSLDLLKNMNGSSLASKIASYKLYMKNSNHKSEIISNTIEILNSQENTGDQIALINLMLLFPGDYVLLTSQRLCPIGIFSDL